MPVAAQPVIRSPYLLQDRLDLIGGDLHRPSLVSYVARMQNLAVSVEHSEINADGTYIDSEIPGPSLTYSSSSPSVATATAARLL